MTDATGAAATPPGAPPATPPAAPATPLTPAEAASRLSMLRNDSAWGAKILQSDPSALAEMRSLAKLVSEGNDLDAMIVAAQDTPDTNVGGELSARKIAGEIPALREHLTDENIRELLSGRVSTPEEVAFVKKFQAARHSSKEWVARFLSNEHEAVREQKLCSIVLSQAPS
jgi:hypothetical protein